MIFEIGVALRYLKFRKGQTFLSLISIISVAGVALGVAALIITLSVMNGFQNDLRQKILGMNAHVVVVEQNASGLSDYWQVAQSIEKNKNVVGTSPFVYGQVILKTADGVSGVLVKGVLPSRLTKVTNIAQYVKAGNLEGLNTKTGIVLGKELARNLAVTLNSELILISSQGGLSTNLGMVPLMKKFKVVGIFDSGMYEYDNNLAYISLASAQNIFNLKNKVTGVEIKTADFFRAQTVAKELQNALGYPFWVRSWEQMNRNLFSALKLEKLAMFIILTLIVLVACFNIVGTLMIITMQKTRCIGILRALGAPRQTIMRIFVWEGLIIGILGLAFGTMGGYLSCLMLDKYQFIKLPGDVYYLDHLPVKTQFGDFGLIAIAAIIISFLATMYPSYKASRLNVVEALRYE